MCLLCLVVAAPSFAAEHLPKSDEHALFYLRSRGIGEEAARALLTYAFASDVVQRIGVEAVRAGLTEQLQRRLPAAADIQEAVV